MAKRKKKKDTEEKAKVHEELEGLDITINEFGQIESTHDLQDIAKFLNKHVEDKKLEGRDFDDDGNERLEEKKKKSKKKKDKE